MMDIFHEISCTRIRSLNRADVSFRCILIDKKGKIMPSCHSCLVGDTVECVSMNSECNDDLFIVFQQYSVRYLICMLSRPRKRYLNLCSRRSCMKPTVFKLLHYGSFGRIRLVFLLALWKFEHCPACVCIMAALLASCAPLGKLCFHSVEGAALAPSKALLSLGGQALSSRMSPESLILDVKMGLSETTATWGLVATLGNRRRTSKRSTIVRIFSAAFSTRSTWFKVEEDIVFGLFPWRATNPRTV